MAAMAASAPAAREPIDSVRITAYGGYFDGSKPVGSNSRQRYDGGELGVDVDLVRARGEVGIDMRLAFGAASATSESKASRTFGLDVAAAFPLVRSEWFGLLVAAGAGGDFGRYPFAPHGRLYPLLGARARTWLSDAVHVDLLGQWLPVTSAGVRDHELRAELGVGIRWAFFGVRGTRTWFHQGTRDHLDLGMNGFFGAMFM